MPTHAARPSPRIARPGPPVGVLVGLSLLLGPQVQAQSLVRYAPWSDQPGELHGLPREFSTWSEALVFDGPTAERTIEATLHWTRAAGAPDRIAVAVVDRAFGEECEVVALGKTIDEDLPEAELESAPSGWGHLVDPALCFVPVPQGAGSGLSLKVHTRRTASDPYDDRFAYWISAQPLEHPARRVELHVEWDGEADLQVGRFGFQEPARQRVLPGDRRHAAVILEAVDGLPLALPLESIACTTAGIAVRSPEDVDAVAAQSAAIWDNRLAGGPATRPLAARILHATDPEEAVRSAVEAVWGAVGLQGRARTFMAPESPDDSVGRGSGTSASRAALLVAVLRAADLRASVLYVVDNLASAGGPWWGLAGWRPIVAVPDLPGVGGGPLLIDPAADRPADAFFPDPVWSRSSAWTWGLHGARWIPLPTVRPRWTWELAATERPDGAFDLSIRGELSGAEAIPGDRGGGLPRSFAPVQGWLDRWGLVARLEPSAAGALAWRAEGVVSADRVLDGPSWPSPTFDSHAGTAPRYAADLPRVDFDWNEEWTFRSPRALPAEGRNELIQPGVTASMEVRLGPTTLRRHGSLRSEGGAVPPAARSRLADLGKLFGG